MELVRLIPRAPVRTPGRALREREPRDPDVAVALAHVGLCASRRDTYAVAEAAAQLAGIAAGVSEQARWTWAQIRAAVAVDMAREEAARC